MRASQQVTPMKRRLSSCPMSTSVGWLAAAFLPRRKKPLSFVAPCQAASERSPSIFGAAVSFAALTSGLAARSMDAISGGLGAFGSTGGTQPAMVDSGLPSQRTLVGVKCLGAVLGVAVSTKAFGCVPVGTT